MNHNYLPTTFFNISKIYKDSNTNTLWYLTEENNLNCFICKNYRKLSKNNYFKFYGNNHQDVDKNKENYDCPNCNFLISTNYNFNIMPNIYNLYFLKDSLKNNYIPKIFTNDHDQQLDEEYHENEYYFRNLRRDSFS